MDGWTIGADVGAMLTGLSALTAAIVWTRTQWRGRQQERAATRLRDWSGYIEDAGISSWYVRLAEEPTEPTARVVLNVVDRDSTPNESRADNMRQRIAEDGQLARVPTPEEYAFLEHLHKERGHGRGFPVH